MCFGVLGAVSGIRVVNYVSLHNLPHAHLNHTKVFNQDLKSVKLFHILFSLRMTNVPCISMSISLISLAVMIYHALPWSDRPRMSGSDITFFVRHFIPYIRKANLTWLSLFGSWLLHRMHGCKVTVQGQYLYHKCSWTVLLPCSELKRTAYICSLSDAECWTKCPKSCWILSQNFPMSPQEVRPNFQHFVLRHIVYQCY